MYQPDVVVTPSTEVKPPNLNRRKLEAVIVCVNYADLLAQTLPHNKQHFDKIVVVTTPEDRYTQLICDYYDVRYVATNIFYQDNAPFNKARGINAGIQALDGDGWIVHLDSDMYLPPLTRMILNNITLDAESVYGIDRLMCHSYVDWINYLARPVLMHELYYLVQARAFPLGSRVAHYNQADGWFPIGFFQLWNPLKSGITRYPENGTGADHTDVVFAKSFPRGNRRLLGEFFGIHLDSERGNMGSNWQGRKTKPFGLEPDRMMPYFGDVYADKITTKINC